MPHAKPIVLYLRGNAFGARSQSDEDTPAALAMADAGAVVIEADYGAASGYTFPAALECGFEALLFLFAKRKRFANIRSRILVAGDEAGGNIAACVALKARDAMPGELAGQILLSPMIDPRMATASIRSADRIGLLESWSRGWSHYLASACDYQHPYAAPCLCTRLRGAAPALIVTSDDDPLRDEALDYAARLQSAGVPVKTRILAADCGWTGQYHGSSGRWMPQFRSEFSQFLKDLPI